jgi:CrcB protein
MAMIDIVLVSVFGGIGCALRVLARDVMQRRGRHPWVSVCAINLLGSLAIGAVLAGAEVAGAGGVSRAVTAATGLLAGWTTYSAFAMDVVQLWWRGERMGAAALWAVTLGGSPMLAWLGAAVTRAAFGDSA